MKTVKINFTFSAGGNGRVRKTKAPVTIEPVVAEYADNTVKVRSGDIYKVVPCKDGSATYFAVS